MRQIGVVCLVIVCLLSTLVSCSEEFSTDPSDQPVLSADTLHMGTLLVGNSSKTYQLKLYNRCRSDLRLTSISLRLAPESGFRMNVDGMNGTAFTQSDLLRIAEGDSMFIFVEATFPEACPGLTNHIDYIDILCNDRLKTIVLEAQSKEVIKLYGAVLDRDSIWPSGLDVQIYDSLVVPQGVTLTLMDSVTLYLHDKADIRVQGTLICDGKSGRPVTIRGDRTDKMFDNLPYDNLPSQWGGLYIDSTAQGCRFTYTDIHGMNQGILIDSTAVKFESCRMKNSDGNLLTCQMSQVTMMNCELSNASGALLQCQGGWYDVTHCTLANYNFVSVARSPAVSLSNYVEDKETDKVTIKPLYQCSFLNTLIYGRWQNPDVKLDYYKSKNELGKPAVTDSIFSYRFDHCLLEANGTDDKDFIQTIWNEDPLYQTLDRDNYTYDFHLLPESPAAEAGAPEGAAVCPVDLDGVQRSDKPTIGCYEAKRKE